MDDASEKFTNGKKTNEIVFREEYIMRERGRERNKEREERKEEIESKRVKTTPNAKSHQVCIPGSGRGDETRGKNSFIFTIDL